MRIGQIQTFYNQFRNYTFSILFILKGVYSYSPKIFARLLFFSISGTFLQGASLGATLFILRHLDDQFFFDFKKVKSFIDVEVHAMALLSMVLLILGFAVLLLYLAEKTANILSMRFAIECNTNLILRFPFIAHRLDKISIDANYGTPLGLSAELKKQSLHMDLASKLILNSIIAFLQSCYSICFLFYLEPILTLILILLLIPLVLPLRHFAFSIRESEKLRAKAVKTNSGDLKNLVRESGKTTPSSENSVCYFHNIFKSSNFAKIAEYRAERRIAVAASRAVSTAALIIAGITIFLYFMLNYSGSNNLVAMIVVYFGAIRICVMSSRQIISRMSLFARSYEQVVGYINDQFISLSIKNTTFSPQVLNLLGKDLSNDLFNCVDLYKNQIVAISSDFPLLAINRYAIATAFTGMNERKKSILVSKISILSNDIDFALEITCREFLEINKEKKMIEEDFFLCCRVLDPKILYSCLDLSLKETQKRFKWSSIHGIELIFLKAFFKNNTILVINTVLLDQLGKNLVDHWIKIFSGCFVFTYYQSSDTKFGRWGEKDLLLIGCSLRNSIGLVSISWANNNPEKISDYFYELKTRKEGSIRDEFTEDDEDDEE